jgi:MscS family membrane protein
MGHSPVRTDDPGKTIASFVQSSVAIENAVVRYLRNPTRNGVTHIDLLLANLRTLIDLEETPAANRQRVGNATVLALLDTFGRIEMPSPDALPATDTFDETEVAAIRVPGTPLRILRIDEGPRAGEWLFEARTVTTAPRFLAGIAHEPVRTGVRIRNWSQTLPQLTGPLVPSRLSTSIPDELQVQWLGLPMWKTFILASAAIVAAIVLTGVNRLARRALRNERGWAPILALVPPILALTFVEIMLPNLARELIPFSQMPDAIAVSVALLSYAARAWLFWTAVQTLVRLWTQSSRDADLPLDRDLLLVIGAAIGGLGVLVIATTGAQRIGIPVVSLAAGLGIGGLAVALAIRPTLENLVGGLLLYVDRPVRIGDFCTFGEQSGTVERIGVRAVWVRGIDRTVISIPNARFADMELINWAACDMMLIHSALRLRFETSTDQMRYVLAEIRRVLHAHPRIDDDTIRIRYVGPSESAKDINLRFYVKTREWNEFFAIREDAFLRIDEVIEEAGARLAVPARTIHVSRDTGGSDPDGRRRAEDSVARWRREGKLPFPKFSDADLDTMDNTLDYPPAGSPDAGTGGFYRAATPELLSEEEPPVPEEEEKR